MTPEWQFIYLGEGVLLPAIPDEISEIAAWNVAEGHPVVLHDDERNQIVVGPSVKDIWGPTAWTQKRTDWVPWGEGKQRPGTAFVGILLWPPDLGFLVGLEIGGKLTDEEAWNAEPPVTMNYWGGDRPNQEFGVEEIVRTPTDVLPSELQEVVSSLWKRLEDKSRAEWTAFLERAATLY